MHRLAYSAIDMQLQHYVNDMKPGFWPRCHEVSIRKDQVSCVLAVDRAYDLVRAYKLDPHLRLIQCDTDDKLLSFVRTWGPLYYSMDEFARGVCSAPLSQYRIFQRWLRGLVAVLSAFKHSTGEREALGEFITSESDEWRSSPVASPGSEPLSLSALRSQFAMQTDIPSWVKNSGLSDVRSALEFLVGTTAFGGRPQLDCVRRAGKRVVEAHWNVFSLEEALRWMVWYDEFTQHPLICCEACRRVFRSETAHARKYCSYECAHRVAAREWQRKQRQKQEG